MTAKHDYSAALEGVPDPDSFTHGNRIMVELTFDEIRAIRASLRQSVELERKGLPVFASKEDADAFNRIAEHLGWPQRAASQQGVKE